MKLAGEWAVSPQSRAVIAMLEQPGHQAFFVGGCVRNALLGEPVKDIDIATDARPETVMALAEATGFKAVPTGLRHGTVTVVAGQVPYEVTTFRSDVETDGRHARVAFTDDLTEDARRRDFTMNALYARADGAVVDPLGGLPDLLARRVRFIEDPGQRIREDYLRILRFFRFSAWYADPAAGFEAETLAAITAHLNGLQSLSRERIGAEMLRLLEAPDPAPALAAMNQSGVLGAVLPGTSDLALAPLVHHEKEAMLSPDAVRRLAALGGEAVAERLRLSKPRARRLARLRGQACGVAPPLELGYRLGADEGLSALLVRLALLGERLPDSAMAAVARGAQAVFPVTAGDLSARFGGPALGAELRRLEALWLESGCMLRKPQLLQSGSDNA